MMNVGNNDTDNVTDVTSNVTSLSQVQLSERQREICKLIKANSFVSSKQMSQVLSVVHRTIQRDLAYMQKSGILVREGNTSAGHWVPTWNTTVRTMQHSHFLSQIAS